MSTMDVVWEWYEESPLLRVTVMFEVIEDAGKLYLKLDPNASGVGPEQLESECVQQYLETIGQTIEDYQS